MQARRWFWMLGLLGACGSAEEAPTGHPPARKWSAPVAVGSLGSPEDGWSGSVKLGLDQQGNALVAWRKFESANLHDAIGSLWWSRGSAQNAFSPPAALGTNAQDLALCVSGSGSALSLWHQRTGQKTVEVLFRRFTPEAGWSGAAQIGFPVAEDHSSTLSICALGAQGDGFAIWGEKTLLIGRNPLVARRWSNGAWREGVDLNADVPTAFYTDPNASLALALDSSGDALALLAGDGTVHNYNGFWARRFSPAGGWGSPSKVSAEQGSDGTAYGSGQLSPSLAVNDRGDAVGAWLQHWYSSSPRNAVQANTYAAGSGWKEPYNGDGGSLSLPSNRPPATAIDNQGLAMVAWTSDSRQLRVASLAPGGAWRETLVATLGVDDTSAWPELACLGDGHFLAVWEQYDGPHQRIAYAEFQNGAWSDVAFISTNESPTGATLAHLAVNASGQAVVVWQQSKPQSDPVSGGEFTLWASRSAP